MNKCLPCIMQTDAASVLNETANNIRYLHEQIKVRISGWDAKLKKQYNFCCENQNILRRNLFWKLKLYSLSIEYK